MSPYKGLYVRNSAQSNQAAVTLQWVLLAPRCHHREKMSA
ncbi:hypothetical protein C4J95_2598 [Pseudomonas orientalis]|nr:hypothetical protein C4J98_2641 [Pseudomonas orientalis]AZF00059.1 hypothetical protein C4J95_2598 [Pseudomonas orientalis]